MDKKKVNSYIKEESFLSLLMEKGLFLPALGLLFLFLGYVFTPNDSKSLFIISFKEAFHDHLLLSTIGVIIILLITNIFLLKNCNEDKLRIREERNELEKILIKKQK
jgi:hypothetical protein